MSGGAPLDAAASDPIAMGWMQGSPPAPGKTLRFADNSAAVFPATRWTFSHSRELVPTAGVDRGDGPMTVFPRAERDDIDALSFTTLDGRPMTWARSLAESYTDGIVIVKRGAIVYERYFGALAPRREHRAFSVTKSYVGTLAAMLAHEGTLDPHARVPHYVPELAGTAFGDATLRQVMDMTTGLRYSEAYADARADVWDYARAGGMVPLPPGYSGAATFYDYLVTMDKEGEHGQAFAYKTVNTEVLTWVLKRITGLGLADMLSQRIWSKLGAERDAYFTVDSIGAESGGGGLNTLLRDNARFGEAMRCDGAFNGQQIVPAAVVADIRRGADPAHFAQAGYVTLPGFSYRNKWWVAPPERGVFAARGIHGQLIWVDPAQELVIARYASHPMAANAFLDPVSLPAWEAVTRQLR